MKIVLTGSTGFAGSEILAQCIDSPSITSIIVLSRRPLSDSRKHDKVNNIVMADFKNYPPEVVEAISDADACIWLVIAANSMASTNRHRCLGGTTIEAEVDFPKAFIEAMTQNWSIRDKPFRYIHCSGVLAEKDQTKSLWFLQDGRRAKVC